MVNSRKCYVKNHIVLFEDSLELYNAQTDFGELQVRLQNIYKVFLNFDDINDEITVLDLGMDHLEDISAIQKQFFSITSKTQSLIPVHVSSYIPSSDNASNSSQNFNDSNIIDSQLSLTRRKIKSPLASLPTFTKKRKSEYLLNIHFERCLTKIIN